MPGPAGGIGSYAVLANLGLEPHSVSETLSARMPTAEERTPASASWRRAGGRRQQVMIKDSRVFEYARGMHAASRPAWTYSFEIPD